MNWLYGHLAAVETSTEYNTDTVLLYKVDMANLLAKSCLNGATLSFIWRSISVQYSLFFCSALIFETNINSSSKCSTSCFNFVCRCIVLRSCCENSCLLTRAGTANQDSEVVCRKTERIRWETLKLLRRDCRVERNFSVCLDDRPL